MDFSDAPKTGGLGALFKDLLAVEEDTKFQQLVLKPATGACSSQSNASGSVVVAVQRLFGFGSDPSVAIYAAMLARAQKWSMSLQTALVLRSSSIAMLSPLKEVAEQIFEGRKLALLRAKIEPQHEGALVLDQALYTLEELVQRILAQHAPPTSFSVCMAASFSAVPAVIFTNHSLSNIREIRLQQITHLFSSLNPAVTPHWQQNLLWRFRDLESCDDIRSALKSLSGLQASTLLEILLHKELNGEIRKLITHLPWEILSEILYGIDDELLVLIAGTLKIDSTHTQSWYNARWLCLTQGMARKVSEHALLCRNAFSFMKELEKPSVEGSLLLDMKALHNTIAIHLQATHNVLQLLERCEAHESFLAVAQRTLTQYESLIESFSDDSADGSLAEQILATTCFANLDDDDQVIEALNEWAILSPKAYKELGLLPGVSDAALEEGRNEPGQFFALGVKHLETLGITEVGHLRERGIYGRNMLKVFIAKQQVDE